MKKLILFLSILATGSINMTITGIDDTPNPSKRHIPGAPKNTNLHQMPKLDFLAKTLTGFNRLKHSLNINPALQLGDNLSDKDNAVKVNNEPKMPKSFVAENANNRVWALNLYYKKDPKELTAVNTLIGVPVGLFRSNHTVTLATVVAPILKTPDKALVLIKRDEEQEAVKLVEPNRLYLPQELVLDMNLRSAVEDEDTAAVEKLLSQGAQPNMRLVLDSESFTQTALYVAIVNENANIVKLLVDHGAHITEEELDLAKRLGNTEVIELLEKKKV